jgi:hypothetical protein
MVVEHWSVVVRATVLHRVGQHSPELDLTRTGSNYGVFERFQNDSLYNEYNAEYNAEYDDLP